MSARRSDNRRWFAVVHGFSLYTIFATALPVLGAVVMTVGIAMEGMTMPHLIVVALGLYSVFFLMMNVPMIVLMYIISAVTGWRSSFTRKERLSALFKSTHRKSWYFAFLVAGLSLLFLGWS
jgi:hypothetical protein